MPNRLDIELVERGLIQSREKAKQLIKSRGVLINNTVCDKPSFIINKNDVISIIPQHVMKYVGRGGLKLEKAINFFNISVKGLICLDIGASTGGFTDCLLQNGAEKVFALDVGHSQLDEKLLNNYKVVNIENTNIRDVSKNVFNDKIEFICTDVSFISLKHILPKINELLEVGCYAVLLIKPQFEAGKSDVNKNGIVKKPKVHVRVIKDILLEINKLNMCVKGLTFSPIKGGNGNIEYLMLIKNSSENSLVFDIDNIVSEAFSI